MTLPSEFELIEKLFAPLATSPGAFGLKDDVAAIAPRAGCELIVTTDAIVAGIDFLPGDPAEGVARKALRVNLSDLAAKGAEPFGYLLTLLIPGETSPSWLAEFAGGLRQDQERFAISLLGGDMSSTPGSLSVSVTALGHVPAGRLVRRNGARAGDGVFVTGTIGDSGGGLDLLRHPSPGVAADVRAALIARYRLPEPRVGLAQSVRGASASIDVSDGLLADLGHIARASGVRIVVEAARVPRSDALKALWGESQDAWVRAATAGDDYEIAFTASSPIAGGDIPVARIGRVEQGSGVVLLGPQGREIEVPRAGYRHF
jgi:thiamine-monophosphate kinase